MKKTQVTLCALLAMSMGVVNVASAQDNNRPDRRDGPREHQRERHEEPRSRPPPDFRGGPPQRQMEHGRLSEMRGAGPEHNFRRGGRLPYQYRSRQYVVEDWRGHHLNAPPRGYHWVQTGSDYVLAAIATGIILQVLLNQ